MRRTAHTHRRWAVNLLEIFAHALEQLYTYVVVRSDFPAHAAATRPGSSSEEEAFLHGLVFVEVDIQCLDVLVREL